MIVTIEVIQDKAFNLLLDMERLDLIRLNAPAANAATKGVKLSERFAGALQLSDAAYEARQNALREGREEWTRNIC